MNLDSIDRLLSRRFFAEAVYFAGIHAIKSPSARAHLLAGIACCACAEPLARAQRLLEGAPMPEGYKGTGLAVSPISELPYEGLFHLLEAVRLERGIKIRGQLRDISDEVADNLAYVSRRELSLSPERRKKYSLSLASLMAGVLLRQLTGSHADLPAVASPILDHARETLESLLRESGGDAVFYSFLA